MGRQLLLFGYPVAHSRSPAMHNAALQTVGLSDWSYSIQAVPPDELPQAVAQLRQADYQGANVTIPHKQRVIPLLDALTPTAQLIGAVNTIFKDGERLVGDNTDASGFLADLKHQAAQAGSLPRKALLLGAGGSARAVLYALHQAGWIVTIAARRLVQAQPLVAAYSPGSVKAIKLQSSSLRLALPGIDLLVNTTPLGMHPDVEGCPWPPELQLPRGAFIYDLVYQPAETILLQRARQAGLGCANGLGMLVEQAALAFERWTGIAAPRAVMFQAVKV